MTMENLESYEDYNKLDEASTKAAVKKVIREVEKALMIDASDVADFITHEDQVNIKDIDSNQLDDMVHKALTGHYARKGSLEPEATWENFVKKVVLEQLS